jgi:hypothetical protein
MSQSPLGPAQGDPELAEGSKAATSQAPPNLVRVYVYTDAAGEAAELGARRDSVKDLRAALAEKKKGLVLVDTEDVAHVSLEVVERTVTIPKFVFGTGILPGQRPGVPGTAGPVREVHLHVKLTWRDESVVFTNKNSPIESGSGWRSAANDIAKQLDKWIVDHRAQILRVP